MVHGKIDTGGLFFNKVLLDVETLNQKALDSELDITKISYAAYGHLRDKYTLLRSGGALGRGCGPLIVAKRVYSMSELRNKRIAIPGKLTTAFLLLRLFNPAFTRFIEMPFDRIMDAVSAGEVDAGLIIHESRFTYPSYGLKKIMDLGEWWEKETGLPIPLGGIIARRDLGDELASQTVNLIKQSVEYAFSNRSITMKYIKGHAQELSEDVINQHIDLYVNDYSLDLGEEGERAVREFIARAEQAGIIPAANLPLFS